MYSMSTHLCSFKGNFNNHGTIVSTLLISCTVERLEWRPYDNKVIRMLSWTLGYLEMLSVTN